MKLLSHVDIWSKGEVVNYLVALQSAGLVKDCESLEVTQEYTHAFFLIVSRIGPAVKLQQT